MTNKQIVLNALLGLADLAAINDEILAAEQTVDAAFEPGGILADCIITLDRTAERDSLGTVLVTTDESVDASEVETMGVPVGPCDASEAQAA